MILHNGSVRTGDARLPLARALAIAGDRIGGGVDVREGDRSRVSNERIDLDGRCVAPGFTDAHVHFLEWSLSLGRLDLSRTRSHAEVLAAAKGASPGADGWLIGDGWRASRWPGGDPEPHREALDAVCGDLPVLLWAHDHHTAWLSSAALALLPVGVAPVVERDAGGEPTGVLRETAAWDAAAAIPVPRESELDEAVARGLRAAHAQGVTGIHDFQREHGLAAWQRLHADHRLTLRVWASLPAERLDEIIALGLRSGFGDEWLQIGPVKAFADGTLGSRTAFMLEPFADAGRGAAMLSPEELRELATRSADAGLELAVHAIGDAANRAVLDALETTRKRWSPRRLRPRVEHAQVLHLDDLPRFAALGVTASMQPSHAPSDRSLAEAVWGARCAGAYALGSLALGGAALCFGSDAPIEPLDPLAGVQAAATRDWPTSEALSVEHALDGFWSGAAYARQAERRLGRLLPGYAADLVVLERDPVTCPPEEIGEIGVVATMVAGRWVHGRPPW
ncbi:MAG TPA: amidohydrolase [Gaiellales bacterium]|nr:amidohydrolase [Gaiellales bacterium]